MSGAEDLARLTQTIDKTNELLLSPVPKMMDVGDGVMRPTNALVMSNLATLLGGAMPYASVELGLLGTVDGTNFSVLSSAQDEYIAVYRNEAGSAVYVDTYPNAKATQNAGDLAESAYALALPRSLDQEMPWAILDQYYRAILGVKNNGAVHAILDKLPGLDLIGDYVWAVADENGVVLLGIKWSGEVVVNGQSSTQAVAFAEGPVGGQDIWVLVDGVPYQVTSSGDNLSPQVSNGRISYMRRYGPVASVTVDLPVSGSVAAFVTEILHIVSSGQSLSTGSGSVPVTTLQPPTANRLFTLQDGVVLSNQDGTLTEAMVAPFKPLVSKDREVPVVQLSAQLNRVRALPSGAGVLASNHGRGGFTLDQLAKGTLPYTNSMTAVTAAKAECTSKGYSYRVPFVDWIHGEADYALGPGAYLAKLLQLQSDYEADIKAVSAQSGAIPLLLDQVSNWTRAGFQSQSNVAQDQLQAALTYPEKFVCAGPKYWLQTLEDGVHLTFASSMRLGCMHARAAQAIINGQSWLPTHCISAVRSGQKVTLRFHTPFGPLVVDKTNVTDPGNLGIRWIDSTSSATVASVALLGGNVVELTLSALPTGTSQQVGIGDLGTVGEPAGPTTGARTCLRDSSPDLDGYGQPLFNWACHQRIAVV
ncbi:hypothetical protein [Pseudomonas putida]|uniref:hypothetical protein n=1 Tax=Pseudomonas putida TaxID=303 RepID=UPI0023E3ACFD|nr:hypothetical protein [Pseudomonas putida]MDF3928505.1 hypothetical protein [Pseudomonas putida]